MQVGVDTGSCCGQRKLWSRFPVGSSSVRGVPRTHARPLLWLSHGKVCIAVDLLLVIFGLFRDLGESGVLLRGSGVLAMRWRGGLVSGRDGAEMWTDWTFATTSTQVIRRIYDRDRRARSDRREKTRGD